MYKIALTCLILIMNTTAAYAKIEQAIFAGGSFWLVEADFNQLDGVLGTVSGFDGGKQANPTYDEIDSGKTNYIQSVRVFYNSDVIDYKKLVNFFWRHIDPTSQSSPFCDNGPQYRSAIFYLNTQQKRIALESKKNMEKRFKTIYTEIRPSTQFYAAEDMHQRYYEKHPFLYKYYRYQCGRDQRVSEVWNKESKRYGNKD